MTRVRHQTVTLAADVRQRSYETIHLVSRHQIVTKGIVAGRHQIVTKHVMMPDQANAWSRAVHAHPVLRLNELRIGPDAITDVRGPEHSEPNNIVTEAIVRASIIESGQRRGY